MSITAPTTSENVFIEFFHLADSCLDHLMFEESASFVPEDIMENSSCCSFYIEFGHLFLFDFLKDFLPLLLRLLLLEIDKTIHESGNLFYFFYSDDKNPN
jgi:phosphatidate phosphatase PAH1